MDFVLNHRSQVLRMTVLESELADERLLLAVVHDESSRLMVKASLLLADLIPGMCIFG